MITSDESTSEPNENKKPSDFSPLLKVSDKDSHRIVFFAAVEAVIKDFTVL